MHSTCFNALCRAGTPSFLEIFDHSFVMTNSIDSASATYLLDFQKLSN